MSTQAMVPILGSNSASTSYAPKGSSNQWMTNMPSTPQMSTGVRSGGGQAVTSSLPAFVDDPFYDPSSPQFGGNQFEGGGYPSGPQARDGQSGPYTSAGRNYLGEGYQAFSPLDPGLTSDLFNFLHGNIGRGAEGFSGSTALPSGGETAPGQLTADLNSLMRDLQSFFQGGSSNLPGLSTLRGMSETGMPVDATPAWEAMKEAMQRTIDRGQNNLREQFAFSGNLASSPFGQASVDYQTQAAKDLNAQLLAGQLASQEAARGRQMDASGTLASGGANFAQLLQGMDQGAIEALFNEFLRTRPEYNPLLSMIYGAGTTFPPIAKGDVGLGGVGGFLQNAGSIASGAGDLAEAGKGLWDKLGTIFGGK